MIKFLTTALLVLGLSSSAYAGSKVSEAMVAAAKKEVKSISAKDLAKMIDNEDDVWMLDVREPFMRNEGSIDGMENIAVSRGVLEFDIGSKIEDHNAMIVVYCRSGKAAPLSASVLKNKLHYKNVYYLEDGLEGWLNAGYSIYNAFGEMKLAE